MVAPAGEYARHFVKTRLTENATCRPTERSLRCCVRPTRPVNPFGTVAVLTIFGIGATVIPESDSAFLTTGFGLFIASIIAITEIPAIFIGIGLLKRQNWARIGGLILAVINIIEIPVGTVLGIYALWVLLKPETTALLTSQHTA